MGRRLGKRIRGVAACAAFACLSALLSAAQNAPLGVVQHADKAHLGPGVVNEGATVYGGEVLSTDSGGAIDLRVGTSRYALLENSQASFYPTPKGSVVELRGGTLTFKRDTDGGGIEVVASDVRVVPEGDGAVMGQVTIVSPCKIKITSVLGQLDVISGKEKHTIKEKEEYSVMPEVTVLDIRERISPDDADYHKSHSHKACAAGYFPRGGSPLGAGSTRFLLIATGVGGVVAGVGIYLALESPDRP